MATGQKRITDRFVKYPYPKNVGSNYKKDFKPSKAGPPAHKQAFNLEKEPKSQAKYKFNGHSSHVMDFKPPLKLVNFDENSMN